MKNLSIRVKLLSIVIITIILVSTIIATKSIYEVNNLTNQTIEEYRQNAFNTSIEELKNYTAFAQNIAKSSYEEAKIENIKARKGAYLKSQTDFLFAMISKIYDEQKNKMPEAELKKILLEAIGSVRYGEENDYFFVYDKNSTILKLPLTPEREGTKNNGKHILEFIKTAFEKGEGFVPYEQVIPGKEPRAKLSNIRLFEPYGWVVGTGVYIDNEEKELKAKALNEISKIRFGQDGYFFVYDYDGTNIMHPINPSLVGKNLIENKSQKGIYYIKDLIEAAKKGGGTVIFDFPKSKDDPTLYDKIGYADGLQEWKWMIGTGVYVDNIEKNIEIMHQNSKEKITSIILGIVIIAIVVSVILIFLISFFITKEIISPLERFENGLLSFFKYLNKESSDVSKIEIKSEDEIGIMTKVVNENIERTNNLLKQDEALIKNVKEVVSQINKGNLKERIIAKTDNDSLEELKNILNDMLEIISKKVNNDLVSIDEVLSKYKDMNFTARIENLTGDVAKEINILADTINHLLLENKINGLTLEDSSKILLENVNKLNISSNEAAASLELIFNLFTFSNKIFELSSKVSPFILFSNKRWFIVSAKIFISFATSPVKFSILAVKFISLYLDKTSSIETKSLFTFLDIISSISFKIFFNSSRLSLSVFAIILSFRFPLFICETTSFTFLINASSCFNRLFVLSIFSFTTFVIIPISSSDFISILETSELSLFRYLKNDKSPFSNLSKGEIISFVIKNEIRKIKITETTIAIITIPKIIEVIFSFEFWCIISMFFSILST